MVEVNFSNMKRQIMLLIAGIGSLLSVDAQQIVARIPELEKNETYMNYLREDARLQGRIDSLMARAADVRRSFRDEPENRNANTEAILKIEEQLFALRSAKGGLIERINAIEQEWVLRTMETSSSDAGQESDEPTDYSDAPRSRILVDNDCFLRELSSGDYSLLKEAQRREQLAASCIERFADNYARLIQMQDDYQKLTDQQKADAAFDSMVTLGAENRSLNDSLQGLWSYIFDNKSYAYSFLLDRCGKVNQLERETERLAEAQREAEANQGSFASDALVTYFLQKRALVAFEQTVAREFALYEAQDSLAREMDYLQSVEFRLPRVEPQRRYLLDYRAVDFSSPSKYNARNPIPACKVYDHGTIYRIRVGRYKMRQVPDIFRGVYPLAYYKEEDGRYGYYAGGYATLVEARLACELLLKRGFRRPEIVCWRDGKPEDVSPDEVSADRFRVEISGLESLDDNLKAVIRTLAPDKELVKVGSTYVVGSFADRAVAERLARDLKVTDGSISVEVKEIAAQ